MKNPKEAHRSIKIDVPEGHAKHLSDLAIAADKPLKRYIEGIVREHAACTPLKRARVPVFEMPEPTEQELIDLGVPPKQYTNWHDKLQAARAAYGSDFDEAKFLESNPMPPV